MTSSATQGFGVKLKIGDGGVGAGVKAFVTWGSANTSIRIKRKTAGTAGNGKNITVVSSGASFVKTAIDNTQVSITVPTTATVAMVCAWLYQQTDFDTYWDADYNAVGDGTGVCPARTVTPTASGTDGAEVFTEIAEVKSVSGPELSMGVIDVTNMQSTNNTREFIPSLIDPGEVSFDVNLLGASATQKALKTDMEARTKRNFQLIFTDANGSYLAFSGYIVGFGFSASIEEALSASLRVKVTSTPTWTQL